jgi:hypothetical protein
MRRRLMAAPGMAGVPATSPVKTVKSDKRLTKKNPCIRLLCMEGRGCMLAYTTRIRTTKSRTLGVWL